MNKLIIKYYIYSITNDLLEYEDDLIVYRCIYDFYINTYDFIKNGFTSSYACKSLQYLYDIVLNNSNNRYSNKIYLSYEYKLIRYKYKWILDSITIINYKYYDYYMNICYCYDDLKEKKQRFNLHEYSYS